MRALGFFAEGDRGLGLGVASPSVLTGGCGGRDDRGQAT